MSNKFPRKLVRVGEPSFYGANHIIIIGMVCEGMEGSTDYKGESLVFFSDDIGNFWYLPLSVFNERFKGYVEEDKLG